MSIGFQYTNLQLLLSKLFCQMKLKEKMANYSPHQKNSKGALDPPALRDQKKPAPNCFNELYIGWGMCSMTQIYGPTYAWWAPENDMSPCTPYLLPPSWLAWLNNSKYALHYFYIRNNLIFCWNYHTTSQPLCHYQNVQNSRGSISALKITHVNSIIV